jgi:hypothetical protein
MVSQLTDNSSSAPGDAEASSARGAVPDCVVGSIPMQAYIAATTFPKHEIPVALKAALLE